jgi:hypothetical protein
VHPRRLVGFPSKFVLFFALLICLFESLNTSCLSGRLTGGGALFASCSLPFLENGEQFALRSLHLFRRLRVVLGLRLLL